MVDRVALGSGAKKRVTDSVEAALKTGKGTIKIVCDVGAPLVGARAGTRPAPTEQMFSESHACIHCGISLQPPEPRLFSFNSPYGACPECDGLGNCLEVDPQLVVPDPSKPLGSAIAAWRRGGRSLLIYLRRQLRRLAADLGVSMDTPFEKLKKGHRDIILFGEEGAEPWSRYEGVIPNLERRFKETESEFMKEEINKYMSVRPCETCRGKRLKPEALSVLVREKNIIEMTALSIEHADDFFKGLKLTDREEQIAFQIVKEIKARLGFLRNVGLGYLSLDRVSGTLSGGEAQRIRLATQIGSGLMGVLYVLDEPSIGLHQRDNDKLLDALIALKDLGNTLIVVEHDRATMMRADWLVDLGPGAGKHGGRIVSAGTPAEVMADHERSLTGRYLSGKASIPLPEARRQWSGRPKLIIRKARENNLKSIDVEIPLGVFVCVTGVSGSGKSTLVDEVLYKGLAKKIGQSRLTAGRHDAIVGAEHIDKIIEIDQSPIGRTPRSNPATYTGLFGPVRDLFARLPEARVRGYRPGRFSFNVKGGRCEACEGDGVKTIEMHFLPDVYVTCEVCQGRRFNEQTLEVRYKGKSIADVLAMSVEEALELFENVPQIKAKLRTLHDVGLGYIELGQAATTLSGGEAQRVKLSGELSRRATGRTLYILDEPTTGLHFADIDRLLKVLHRLVDQGNSVLVIEHNLDVIKTADYLIDLGPDGGDKGGELVAAGTPEEVARITRSYTGKFLKKVLLPSVVIALLAAAPCLAAESGSPVQDEAAYRQAEKTFQAGDYEDALRGYSEFLETFPSSRLVAYARYSRAWCLFELGDIEAALEGFRQVSAGHAEHPLAAEAEYKATQCLYELKHYDAALEALEAFVTRRAFHPKVPNAWYLTGECRYNLGNYAGALEAFKKSIELKPDGEFRAFARHGIAWSLFELKDHAGALDAFSAPDAAGTTVADSMLIGRARTLAALDRHTEAIAALEAFLSQYPDSELLSDAYFWVAESLYQIGRYREAADIYRQITRRFPDSQWIDDAHYHLGWTYVRLKQWDDAIEHFELVAEYSHNEALKVIAICRIGDTYLDMDELEKALEAYDRVLKEFPKDLNADYAQFQSATTLQRLGRIDPAILSYQAVIVNHPKSRFVAEALYRQGTALMQKGQFAEAAELFKKVQLLFPDSALVDPARLQLGQCYLNLGRHEEALIVFRGLTSSAGETSRLARYQIGSVLFKMGREAEGEKAFEEYLNKYPDSDAAADALFGLGEYNFHRGQYARAREQFLALVDRFPAHVLADDALSSVAAAFEREGEPARAADTYDRLMREYPKSPPAKEV